MTAMPEHEYEWARWALGLAQSASTARHARKMVEQMCAQYRAEPLIRADERRKVVAEIAARLWNSSLADGVDSPFGAAEFIEREFGAEAQPPLPDPRKDTDQQESFSDSRCKCPDGYARCPIHSPDRRIEDR